MLFRRAPCVANRRRGWANAPGANIELDTLVVCVGFHILQVRFLKALEWPEVRDEQRIAAQLFGVID